MNGIQCPGCGANTAECGHATVDAGNVVDDDYTLSCRECGYKGEQRERGSDGLSDWYTVCPYCQESYPGKLGPNQLPYGFTYGRKKSD